ncbi:MAG: SDR family oxidoreductase [Opitutae bacterium]|jgi:enoyl-[acyl-carrier protein] reductase I|nr:SDR family oxidoreductase [Opitutae bacterium]MBT5717451.1 SDR family oxidoreductase [Opitutae bacterium]
MSFLGLDGKTFLIVGIANRKSVAWAVAKLLEEEGANIIYSVRSDKRKQELEKLLTGKKILVCDFEYEDQIEQLGKSLETELNGDKLDGILHSIAFANYSEGLKKFHETKRADFLQATQISSFSLIELSRICKPLLAKSSSVVTIGISSTEVTAENYGYMAPIKASLDANVRYLAKSFSHDSETRFNSVNAGPLKTSASAGIPGYLVNYLYAEKLTFRKKALATTEVANLATFLLSPRSSGINGQGIIIDAGMGLNYFDGDIVESSMRIND